MKTFRKTFFTLLLCFTCLFGATACANKSECRTQPEPDARTIETEFAPSDNTEDDNCPDCPESPEGRPECPTCPDCPDCPENPDNPHVPENPNHGHRKGRKHKRFPRSHGARIQLMPFEIVHEQTEEGERYVIRPLDVD